MEKILITGGAGFVGSNLGIRFKELYPKSKIIAFDNLKRRGSELALGRLKKHQIAFMHGDVRSWSDFEEVGPVDLIIDCAAEPSVLAGSSAGSASARYCLDTNLVASINILEQAKLSKADLIFLSTSRVYPIEPINRIEFSESSSRFNWKIAGISEEFPLAGSRSIYGASKLASELLVEEYRSYGVRAIINRCGVLTGPWQMGKTDQGVIVLWMAAHYFQTKLGYFGFGGEGKQVRDILHVDDLFQLLKIQLSNVAKFDGQIFNVGGGKEVSVSLKELTDHCQNISGNSIPISKIAEDRPNDLRLYITDCAKVTSMTGWKPKILVKDILAEIHSWIKEHSESLKSVLIG